jgi:phosphatidylinositol-3-phosphatase
MKKYIFLTIVCLILSACQGNIALINTQSGSGSAQTPTDSGPVILGQKTATQLPRPTETVKPDSTATPKPATPQPGTPVRLTGKVPDFAHIVMIAFENHDYEEVIGNPQMPNMNALAKQYVELANYFAVTHPSLPNYIALMSGGTQGITSDCKDCFIDQKNLADLITASGRTWKSYSEDMPSPCFLGDTKLYVQKHNPLLYFDSVRLNPTICNNSIVPLTQLDSDLAANQLPDFSFIMPNMCNSGHECSLDKSDAWIQAMVSKLQSSPALGSNSLIIIVYDEAEKDNKGTCCGIGTKGGGRVPAILISPLAKPGFTDDTAYSHYSMLKTILSAWNLPDLGMTQDPATLPILAPWPQK